ncbi:putative transcriptional activator DEMETER-like [Sesbania bispinosa]|nr:putative transcriptional activator DEMETER-like [Sesbania bispinosa]
MEVNGVGKEEWWSPDTPLKPGIRTIQNNIPLKLIPGEYKVLESDPCVADPGDSNSSNTILMADNAQGDDVEVNPPPPSKKRKNTEEEINDRPHKKTKKKTYRPKVISQLSKRTKKSPVKSSNTPKPSTPNQKRSQERSKSFIRKKGCWTTFNSEGNSTISRKMKSIIKRICSLKKRGSGKANQLVAHEKSGELVPYKRQSLGVDIILDEETLRVWNLLSDEKGHKESDEKRRKYWEEIRNNYCCAVHSFISRMHFIQGDRSFLPWKGSVMDSVVGAFLTQNVSDHLSSSAFMTLAARFPTKTNSFEESNEDARTTDDRQGLIGNNMTFSIPKVEKEMKDSGNVEEKEAQKAQESSKVDNNNKGIENNGSTDSPGKNLGKKQSATVTKKTKNQEEKERLFEKQKYWDML